jgi:gamma-glutamylcyclotransferase (GGCT)/AIG2-like uncharacterized protein YtfP
VDLLFVYGTLRSEFDNQYAVMLRSRAELVGRAVVAGSIFRIAEYPGYRPEPLGVVHGEVYRVDLELLRVLDEYEGAEYERVMVEGMWIYRYLGPVDGERRIESGDWASR